jgi:hypothetical protein
MLILFTVAFFTAEPGSGADKHSDSVASAWVSQLRRDKLTILLSSLCIIVLAFTWIALLARFARVILFSVLFLAVVWLYLAGTYLLMISQLFVGILVFALASILVAGAYFSRDRLSFSATMVAEASRSLRSNVPIFTVVAPALIFVWLFFCSIWIASTLSIYSTSESMRYSMIFMLFVLFWTCAVIFGVFQVTVAGTVAAHLFESQTSEFGLSESLSQTPSRSRVMTSLQRAISHNFGSVCLAGLIIALVQLIRAIVHMLEKLNRKQDQSKVVKFVWDAITGMLSALEEVVQYANQYALIYVAMYGSSFSTAAAQLGHLVRRAGLQSLINYGVVSFLMWCAEFAGVAASVFLTVWISTMVNGSVSVYTLCTCGAIAWTVFRVLSHSVRIASDTVLVCYMEDLERNEDLLLPGATYSLSPEVHTAIQLAKTAMAVDATAL